MSGENSDRVIISMENILQVLASHVSKTLNERVTQYIETGFDALVEAICGCLHCRVYFVLIPAVDKKVKKYYENFHDDLPMIIHALGIHEKNFWSILYPPEFDALDGI